MKIDTCTIDYSETQFYTFVRGARGGFANVAGDLAANKPRPPGWPGEPSSSPTRTIGWPYWSDRFKFANYIRRKGLSAPAAELEAGPQAGGELVIVLRRGGGARVCEALHHPASEVPS